MKFSIPKAKFEVYKIGSEKFRELEWDQVMLLQIGKIVSITLVVLQEEGKLKNMNTSKQCQSTYTKIRDSLGIVLIP